MLEKFLLSIKCGLAAARDEDVMRTAYLLPTLSTNRSAVHEPAQKKIMHFVRVFVHLYSRVLDGSSRYNGTMTKKREARSNPQYVHTMRVLIVPCCR